MGAIVAIVDKRRQNAVPTALNMLRVLARNTSFGIYGLASPTQYKTADRLESLEKEKMTSPVVVGCVCSMRVDVDGCQTATQCDVNMLINGTLYTSEHKKSRQNLSDPDACHDAFQAATDLVRESNGDFAFAIAEDGKVIVGRDSLGVRPLYLSSNTRSTYVASEKKALWSIGIHRTDSFPPGNVAIIDIERVQFRPVRILHTSRLRNLTLHQASVRLLSLLRESVSQRMMDAGEVSVAFSGGVDSTLLALLTKETGKGVQLVCASLGGQPEVEHARKVAEKLRLPILFSLHKLQEIEEVLPRVLYAIETPDPLQVSIAIPVYWTAEKTRETGCRVMLAGQGADELFGGYKRYADTYLKHGEVEARKDITRDTLKMHKLNFERDSKVCSELGIELRLPYVSFDIAEFALTLPMQLLLERSNCNLRKLVLRRVAMDVGLPRFVVEKPKKAMQYTTGVAAALRKLAKKEGFTLKEYLLRKFHRVFGDTENGM